MNLTNSQLKKLILEEIQNLMEVDPAPMPQTKPDPRRPPAAPMPDPSKSKRSPGGQNTFKDDGDAGIGLLYEAWRRGKTARERAKFAHKYMKANMQLNVYRQSGNERALTDKYARSALDQVRKVKNDTPELYERWRKRGAKITIQ